MTTTNPSTATARPAPTVGRLGGDLASRLARTEYERVIATFESLPDASWDSPTPCPGWDVRTMAGHMLGMAVMVTSPLQLARQQLAAGRRAKAEGLEAIDALTAMQHEAFAHLGIADLVQRMRTTAPRAVAFRRRIGRLLGGITATEELVGDEREPWTLGYLVETILTRDPFMHRLDIAQATGVLLGPTADHEGIIVDDVVQEWASRHGRAYDLELTGPAGGRWRSDAQAGDPEVIRMDAFDFCRVLSGRGSGPGLLSTQVPF